MLRILAEALRSATVDLLRRPLFSALSIAATTLAVVVLAGFLLVSRGVEAVHARLSGDVAVEVYLRPGAEPAQVDDLAARLAADRAVREVKRVGPGEALAEFVALYPDLADAADLLGDNPFPASLRVFPREPSAAALAGALHAARTHPATLSVRYDREWLDALVRAGLAVRVAGTVGVAVLVLSALATIGAVVRLALDDRIDEVRLLRLTGAPVSFVIAPPLCAGALLGIAGGGLAVALARAGRSLLEGSSTGAGIAALSSDLLPRLSAGSAAALVSATALACALTSLLATWRAALK